MNDIISRQAALDAMTAKFNDIQRTFKKRVTKGELALYLDLYGVVEALPAQPQRMRGRWIDDAKTYYEMLIKKGLSVDEYTPYFTDDIACSECLAKYSVIDNETQFFKFCPNCGADMRGDTYE